MKGEVRARRVTELQVRHHIYRHHIYIGTIIYILAPSFYIGTKNVLKGRLLIFEHFHFVLYNVKRNI